MDDQEHARLHCALDRILDVVEHPPEDDEGKFLSQRTLDALQDLNAILTGAEPIIRKLWVTVPEDAESAPERRLAPLDGRELCFLVTAGPDAVQGLEACRGHAEGQGRVGGCLGPATSVARS